MGGFDFFREAVPRDTTTPWDEKRMLYQTPPCLFIVSMHRSGSSLLAGCLRALGVSLGDSLMPGNEYNPRGYFENNDIHAVHEQLLQQLGLRWDMVGRLPVDWLESEAAILATKRLSRILDNQFCGRGTWSVKDPRACRVLPLWQRLLADRSIPLCPILIVRHPEEVAASLNKRDGLDRETGRLLWLTYHREALSALRGVRHAIITYDQLLADPLSTLRSLDAFFSLELPLANSVERVLALINPGLRHNVIKEQPAVDPVADAYTWLYNTLSNRRIGGPGAAEEAGILKAADPSLATELPLAPVQPFAPAARLDASVVHGQAILTDILNMVGRYEQRERDDRLQRERAFLSSASNPLFTATYLPPSPTPGSGGDSTQYHVLIPDEWNEIRVDLPSALPLRSARLRVDPLVRQQGLVTLGALRLVHAATNDVLWAADKPSEFQTCQCNEQVCVLDDPDVVRLLCMGADAQIHLPALPELPDVPVRLILWIKASRDTYPLRDLLAAPGALRQQLQHAHDIGGQLQAEKNALADQVRDLTQQAQTAATDLEQARAASASLTEELDRIRREKIQAPAEQNLAQSLKGAQSRIQDLIQQVGNLETEVERVQAEKNEIADFGGQLMAEKKILSNQLHDLNQRAKTAEASAVQLTEELERVQAEKQRIADIGGQLQVEKNALADQVRDLTQQAQTAATDLESKRAEAEALAQELEHTRAEKNNIADIGGQLQAEKNALAEQVRELIQQVQTAATDLEGKGVEAATLAQELEQAQAEKDALDDQVRELTQQAQITATDLESKRAEADALIQELEQTQAEKNRIADIGGQLQAENNALDDQVRELTEQVQTAATDLEQERATAAQLAEELDRTRGELTQLSELLQASLGREESLTSCLQAAQADTQVAKQLRDRLNTLQEQFLSLTQEMEASLNREESLSKRAETLEADLATAQTRQQTLNQERDQARAELDRQTQRSAELEHALEGKQTEFTAALTKTKTYQAANEALSSRLLTAMRHITALERQDQAVRSLLQDKAKQLARHLGSPKYQLALQLLRSFEHSSRRMARAKADRKAFLEQQIALIKERGALDIAYYETNNPDVREQQFPPVEHYVRHGWTEGRSPKPGFDDALYLLDHPDIIESGLCPLAHALTQDGTTAQEKDSLAARFEQNGRSREFEVALVRQSGLFDDAYYAGQHPELAALTPDDRLRHYLTKGWKQGYRPNAWLAIPDMSSANGQEFSPLVQMLLHGFVPGTAGACPQG